ncbi:MAG TPA: hypothetical protein VFA94_01550 [Acidimicrobiales bacterium]|nr:hypothetical protein [Acidimicrobiales bacterium]
MRLITRKRLAGVGVAMTATLLATAAFAYWTTTGDGHGTATTDTANAITVNQTSSNLNLYPGGSSDLLGDFDNTTNAGKVFVAGVTAVVHPFSVQPDDTKPACTEADFSITGTATVNAEIGHGTDQGSWSGLTLNMLDDPVNNQDNCKGLTASTLKIDYTAHAS